MAAQVKAVPEGTHTITAHLVVRGGDDAIAFYEKAFGAKLLGGVHHTPDGRVMHATLQIGDSRFMLADEFPGMGSSQSPRTLGGTSVVLNIYVDNVDSLFNQAVSAGAKVTMPLANQFWGDRYGQVSDPFGHQWALGQHVEDVAPEEMEKRAREMFAQMAKGKGQSA
ncbi:MAG TPA: VOC family protein [Terriglobia bacterium]|nr:VOC family protein [Terriglobia bacterium]